MVTLNLQVDSLDLCFFFCKSEWIHLDGFWDPSRFPVLNLRWKRFLGFMLNTYEFEDLTTWIIYIESYHAVIRRINQM